MEEAGISSSMDGAQDPGGREDAGSAQDPGGREDAGSAQDPGGREDAGSAQNPGGMQGAGSAQDPGGIEDPGSAQDTGGGEDAGRAQDTGGMQGAGSAQDPGGIEDPGSAQDTGGREDAGSAQDTGGREDAGRAQDPGGMEDAGRAQDPGSMEDAGSAQDPGGRESTGPGGQKGCREDPGGSGSTEGAELLYPGNGSALGEANDPLYRERTVKVHCSHCADTAKAVRSNEGDGEEQSPGQGQSWDPMEQQSRKSPEPGVANFPRLLTTVRREEDYMSTVKNLKQLQSKSDSGLLPQHKITLGTLLSLQTDSSWLYENLTETAEFPGNIPSAAKDFSALSDHDEDIYSSLSDDLSELSVLCDMEFNADYVNYFDEPLQTLPSVGPPTILAYKRESLENESHLAIKQEHSERIVCEYCGNLLKPFPLEEVATMNTNTVDLGTTHMSVADMGDRGMGAMDKVAVGMTRVDSGMSANGTVEMATADHNTFEKVASVQSITKKAISSKDALETASDKNTSVTASTSDKVCPEELFCCKHYKEVCEFLLKEQQRVFNKHSIETISVAPHAPFGSEIERKKAKEKTAQRLRERQMAKLYESLTTEPTLSYVEYGKPLKTISYQLSNAPPVGDSWTVLPESSVPESIEPESLGHKLNTDRLDTEVTFYDFTITSEKVMPAQFVEKYYSNERKFLTVFPDGTAQIFYPSGNLAIIVITNKVKETVCIIKEDKTNNADILAVFSSFGKATCYHPNGIVWLNINPVGGQYSDNTGTRVRRWKWRHTALSKRSVEFKPIFISLNHQVGVRIFKQDQMFVSFLAMGKQAKFNVGSKRAAKGQVEGIELTKDVQEDELLLFAIKIKVLILLNKLHDCLHFPSNEQWYRIKPPAFILSQAQKLIHLCDVCNISKEVDSSIRDIIGSPMEQLCA